MDPAQRRVLNFSFFCFLLHCLTFCVLCNPREQFIKWLIVHFTFESLLHSRLCQWQQQSCQQRPFTQSRFYGNLSIIIYGSFLLWDILQSFLLKFFGQVQVFDLGSFVNNDLGSIPVSIFSIATQTTESSLKNFITWAAVVCLDVELIIRVTVQCTVQLLVCANDCVI